MDRAKRIWYLSPMRAAKVQASLRIRAVSPEPPLLTHTSSESRGTFRQKARSLAPLNGWACAVKICNDGMLEDTNSLDGAHMQTDQMFRWNYIGNWYVSLNISTIANINSVRTPLCYLNFSRFVLQKERWDLFRENRHSYIKYTGQKRLG